MSSKRLSNNKGGSKKGSYTLVPTVEPRDRSPSPSATSLWSLSSMASEPGTEVASESDEELDQRSAVEKELFALVNQRKGNQIREFLQTYRKSLNINQTNTEGISVIDQAVINNDEEIVDILLEENNKIDISDALLYAVKENMVEMVHKLLKWQDAQEALKAKTSTKQRPVQSKTKITDDGDSGDTETPFLAAATCGHYELIELLYNRGERLQEVSDVHKGSSVDLRKSNNRIKLLKGLTNPTYLAFMTGAKKDFDPVIKVFEILRMIENWIKAEPEFTSEYQEIVDAVKLFPVDLLSMCRTAEETKIFLGNRIGYNGLSKLPYPRLLHALELNQKEFVAHKNAQDVLYREWVGERWVTSNDVEALSKNLFIAMIIILFPFISLILLVTCAFVPNSRMYRVISAPVNRYRANAASYAVFLVVLFSMNSAPKSKGYLGPPSYFLPWVVGVFVLSHLLAFVRQLFINPKHFLNSGWNVFELVIYVFWLFTFECWAILVAQERVHKHGTNETHALERGWLPVYDRLLISEVTTGIASTMAGLKFLKMFILHRTIGPLQIALGKMTKDVVSFMLFFLVIIVSFSLGIQHLYRPYTTYAEGGLFCQFFSAMEAFFWALFTMTEAGSPGVKEHKIGEHKNITNHHFLSESVGKVVFVSFHVLCVTFLLNMLLGVMSNTYSNIQGNVRVEWVFGRTRLWVYYINDSIVPPPFSIILNLLSLLNCALWQNLCASYCGFRGEEGSLDNLSHVMGHHCWRNKVETTLEERKAHYRAYRNLLRRLLQRYFRSKMNNASVDAPVTGDIQSVQNYVAQLKTLAEFTLEQTSQSSLTNLSAPPPPEKQPSPEAQQTEENTEVEVIKPAGDGLKQQDSNRRVSFPLKK